MNTTVYNNSNKIQDFGQKIGGARKDYFAELKEFGESLCKVDIETLKMTNQSLISTLDEVMKIQEEGREKRRAAEVELGRIESELKGRLLQMRA